MLEFMLDDTEDGPVLLAVREDETWNGWSVPVVTVAQFRSFIAAWASNDPNGEWYADGITVSEDGSLTYRTRADETDVWAADQDGLYPLCGWVFVPVTRGA